MKVVSSLKSLKKRDINCKVVRRRGKLYVINKKNPNFLQTRVATDNMLVNIVGFAIVNNEENLQCLNISDFKNISDNSSEVYFSISNLKGNDLLQKILYS